MSEIDVAIGQVEKLYRAVTGQDVPPAGAAAYAPIPPEKDPQGHVEEQVERLRKSLEGGGNDTTDQVAWMPAVNVWESEPEYFVCVDLPGVSRDTVKVVVDGDAVTVSGERTAPSVEGEKSRNLRWVEGRVGRFRRAIALPVGILPEKIQANLRDGVLELRLPRMKRREGGKAITIN